MTDEIEVTTFAEENDETAAGAPMEEAEYKALNPTGKALIKAAAWQPPPELISDEYPFWLITGRTLYHFHTRTKTGRVPELQAAAPDVWVEMSLADARARKWLAEQMEQHFFGSGSAKPAGFVPPERE